MAFEGNQVTFRELSGRLWAGSLIAQAAIAVLLASATAHAGFITINKPEVKAIFSQPSFAGTPISIRFEPQTLIVAPELLRIDDLSKLKALYNLAPDPAPIVDAFFVDQLDSCGSLEPTVRGLFAGCAQLPGHVFVEASDLAAMSPAPLLGHELGHNLNLQHDLFSSSNLMAPFFPPGTELTQEQVSLILQSPLVQIDAAGRRFIEIRPIAIVAAPEPSTWLLLGVAFGAVFVVMSKRTASRLQAGHGNERACAGSQPGLPLARSLAIRRHGR